MIFFNFIRTLLQELDEEDENCIFIVRRIHKFGFKSPVFLREYFEEYGQVRNCDYFFKILLVFSDVHYNGVSAVM